MRVVAICVVCGPLDLDGLDARELSDVRWAVKRGFCYCCTAPLTIAQHLDALSLPPSPADKATSGARRQRKRVKVLRYGERRGAAVAEAALDRPPHIR